MLVRVESRNGKYAIFNMQTVPRVGELILTNRERLYNVVTEVIHFLHDECESEIVVRTKPL